MTATQAFLIAGGVVGFFFLLAALAAFGWMWVRRQQAIKQAAKNYLDASEKLAAAVDSLEKAVAAMTAGAQDLPALEKGLIAVSQEQVKLLMELREDHREYNANVSKLYKGLFAKDSDAYQEFDEKQASKAYEVQEMVDKGMPREEAEQRVDQARIYSRRTLMGA